ncbi:MAG TPA: hypothetical protein VMH86_15015 [Rhizomicrobium sp.]|nr:hypothetical protein [Rhizomicrobium sp.]
MVFRKIALAKFALFGALALSLSGCFDLTQSVWLNKGGAGHYDMTIAATGAFGEALRQGKSDVHVGHNPNLPTRTKTVIANGKTFQTTVVDFKQLSDLALSNESVAVKVRGHDLFGLGSTHAVFRRIFFVDNEMKKRQRGDSGQNDEEAGKAILASMFGDHTYVFRVHLPGSIDWIAPVYAGDIEVKPDIRAEDGGYTISWAMPLTDMMETKTMRFSVGFSAWGGINDSETQRDDRQGTD